MDQTDNKWKACRHIMREAAKSAVMGLGDVVVCRPCAVSGIEELSPVDRGQLVSILARAGIKEVLLPDDVFPKKVNKAEIHPCNACARNRSNLILLFFDVEPICKDLSGCPYSETFSQILTHSFLVQRAGALQNL